MTFGSLFAGIGGFDIGFERAGMQNIWQVEKDAKCNAVRRKHWPNVGHYEDVKEFHAKNAIRPDIICGGFPCQDLSVAGRRAGLAGERSGLFHEFMRIVAEFRPRWVCIENVPGLLSSNKGRDMGTVVGTLGKLRYRWAYRVLDAQYFGVAQRRRRVFIVGSLGDGPHPAEILFDAESLSRDTPTRGKAGEGTTGATAYCTSGNCGVMPQGDRTAALNTATDPNQNIVGVGLDYEFNAHNLDEPTGPLLKGSPTGGGHPLPAVYELHGGSKRADRPDGGFYVKQEPTTKPLDTSGLNPGCNQGGVVAFAQNQRDEVRDLNDKAGALQAEPGIKQQTFVAGTLAASGAGTERPAGQGNELDFCIPIQYAEQLGREKRQNGMGLGDLDSPQYTLECRQVHGVLGLTGVRRLTPRECERLQGFPDDFTRWDADGNEISDSARYRMLGNAVAVPVSAWIAKRIVESQQESKP